MYQSIAHLLILLVLFTHSTMAMDVHIPHNTDHSIEHITDTYPSNNIVSTSIDLEQTPCIDAGGHCSHHQAHTSGLLSATMLVNTDKQPVFLTSLNASIFIDTQAPPLRPPKA